MSVLALVFVFSKIEFAAVWSLIRETSPIFLLLSLLAFIASQIVSAFRLNLFFRKAGVSISEWLNLKLYAVGMFYNLLLPGGIGGDGYKVLYLKNKQPVQTRKLIQTLILDRLVGLLALLMLLIVLPHWLENLLPYQEFSGLLIIPLALMAYAIGFYFFKSFLSLFFPTLIQSLLVQSLQLLAAWFILKALGLGMVPLAYLLLFLLSSIAAAVPFTVGGAGARELVFLFGSEWFGIDTNIAISLSLIFYLITVLVSFSGMYFSFKKELDI